MPAPTILAAITVLVAGAVAEDAKQPRPPVELAKEAHARALAELATNPDSIEWRWKLARACFDWADWPTNDVERAALATQGIKACREAIEHDPKCAPAHYYLGMNLGQMARTKTLGALKLVREMECAFLTSRELDEQFDQAGPDRNLGLLYLDAPGWPASIGSRRLSRQHLERAVKLVASFPENHLNLAEAYYRWKDASKARREVEAVEKLWPQAREALSGERWAASWTDWESRLARLRQNLSRLKAPLRLPKDFR